MNLLTPLIAAAALVLLAAAPAGKTIIINPGCDTIPTAMKRWKGPLTRGDLREWAAGRGLRLSPDAAPLIDDCAAMLSDSRSSVIIDGLDRTRRYTLWIDFVRFVPVKGAGIHSDLVIQAVMGGGRYMNLAEYSFGALPPGPVRLEIPYELSSSGRVELYFNEISGIRGFWGVWDILIGVGELPDRIDPDDGASEKMDLDTKPLE